MTGTPETDALYRSWVSTADTPSDAAKLREMGDLCRKFERQAKAAKELAKRIISLK